MPWSRSRFAAIAICVSLAQADPSMTMTMTVQNPSAQKSRRPAPLLDNARPVFIFTPTHSDPRAAQQLAILYQNRAAAEERQIVTVLEVEGQASATLPQDPGVRLTPQDSDQAAARRRFKVAPGQFTVILAGKDGGEKLRSSQPIPFATLRDTIDSMPMRRQEMRRPD
jgi:hypothetical protein